MKLPTYRLLLVCSVFLACLCGCDFFISADERIERAEMRIAAGEDRAAAIELLNALRSEPKNIRARMTLVDVSLRLGDVRSAEKELAVAATDGASPTELAELRARIALANGEFEALLSQIDSSTIALKEPAISTYRGLALHGLGRLEPAIESFERALKSDPSWHPARIGMAETLTDQGRSEDAIRELQMVLDENPRSATAWMLKGTLLTRQGDMKSAIPALNAALEYAPGELNVSQSNSILVGLIQAHVASGDMAAAKSTYSTFTKRVPDGAFTQVLAARIAMAEGDFPRAIAESQKALVNAPGLFQAKLLLGAALLANGNLNQAEAQLAELVQIAPESIEARKLLAQTHLRLNRPDRAAQVLEPVSEGDSAQVDAILGFAKLESGDEEGAIALLERSLRVSPNNAAVQLDLALAYLRAGSNERARELLRSIDDQPSNIRREALMIAATAAAGGTEAGRAEVERAVAENPQSVELLNVAASYFAQLGDFQAARGYVQRALSIDQSNASTLMNGARIELSAQDPDSARAMLEAAVGVSSTNTAARILLAQIAFGSGDQEKGIRSLEEARKSDPNALDPKLFLAAAYLRQDKELKAKELIAEAWDAADDKASISSAIGRLMVEAGRYDAALLRFRESVQYDQSNAQHWMNLAGVQQALGDDASARESINKALALQPDWIAAAAMLAMIDARTGNTEGALALVGGLKERHPKHAGVILLEGDIAALMRRYGDAARAYAQAFALKPSRLIAIREYRARQLGKLQGPLAPLSAWLEAHPNDAGVRLMLAEAYALQGRSKAAIEEYESIARGPHPSPAALNNLAWMYLEVSDSRAEVTAKKAYELAPKVPAIADTYGWILVRTGNAQEGLKILKAAASAGSTSPEIRYHYAVALNEVGHKEDARNVLRSLLETKAVFAELEAARQLLGTLGG